MQTTWLTIFMMFSLVAAAAGEEVGDVLFSDTFATLRDEWGEPDAIQEVRDGSLVMTPRVGTNYTSLLQGRSFGDADIRVTITLQKGGGTQSAGIAFWGTNYNNLYALAVYSDGDFRVARRVSGKTLYPVFLQKSDAIRQGPGAVNNVRVVTRGSRATIFINDKVVAQFKGFPPRGDSAVGLQAASGDDEVAAWGFSNFIVRSVPGPRVADPVDESILFADDFSTLDPAWGSVGDIMRLDGNRLVVSPPAKSTYTALYKGATFGNMDLRITISLTNGDADHAGGLIFWASDTATYYAVETYSDGTIGVLRKTQGKTLVPVGGRIVPSWKAGLGQANELRLVTSGNTATISANGEKVVTFRGYPPVGESQVGILARSGDVPHGWTYSDLTIRRGPESATSAPSDDTLLLADTFETLDPAWGFSDDMMHVEDHALVLSAPPGMTFTTSYKGRLFDDIDFRVTVNLAKGSDTHSGGVIFWKVDAETYYKAGVYSDGSFQVSRRFDGKWSYPIVTMVVDALRTGNGQKNELRVVTNGRLAAFFINDQRVGILEGFPPDGGSTIGLVAQSGPETFVWQFTDLRVRSPSADAMPKESEFQPVPEEVATAWKDINAEVGWMRANDAGVPVFRLAGAGREKAVVLGDLPAFRWTRRPSGISFRMLPSPNSPFGIMIMTPAEKDARLAELAPLKKLEMLSLFLPQMTDAGLGGLSELRSLRTLMLTCPQMTDVGLRQVAGLPQLERLTIGSPKATDVGLRSVAGLTTLKMLNASCPLVTDEGLRHLAGLTELRRLNVSGSRISDAAIPTITGMTKLRTLEISRTTISDAGLERLRIALPGCTITRNNEPSTP
jgi:hypothetical protein